MHSLHCKRNPQQAKIRFVAKSATLLIFFDLLCCFGFHKQRPKQTFADSTYICGFDLHFADFTYILRNPLTVAESRTTS